MVSFDVCNRQNPLCESRTWAIKPIFNMEAIMAKFPFVRFLLKFRVNPRNTAKLKEAGIRLIDRSVDRQQAIEQGHSDQKGHVHYTRHTRTDATGAKMGDSGRPIFGWNAKGTPYDAISLEKLSQDIHDNGGILTDVHMVRKPGDTMASLVLVFSAEGTRFELTTDIETALDKFVDASYGHLHGFINPDDTATMNAAHLFDRPLTEAKDPRYVRFLLVGDEEKPSFRCHKREISAPTEASASA